MEKIGELYLRVKDDDVDSTKEIKYLCKLLDTFSKIDIKINKVLEKKPVLYAHTDDDTESEYTFSDDETTYIYQDSFSEMVDTAYTSLSTYRNAKGFTVIKKVIE